MILFYGSTSLPQHCMSNVVQLRHWGTPFGLVWWYWFETCECAPPQGLQVRFSLVPI